MGQMVRGLRQIVVPLRWPAVFLLALSACGDAPESGVVARVGGWTLTETELAELLVLAQPFPLDPLAVEDFARHWIGVAALAQRTGDGDDLTGDETVAASTWLDREEALLAADREDRLGLTPVPDPETAYQAGGLRLLAHVLLRVGPETSGAELDLQRRTAQRILAALLAGGSWDDAVAESQDSDTRDASGLLGLFGAGELPPALDRVAFRLEPGQVSSVIQSEGGFHILYRPRYDDVAGLFAIRLRDRRLAEAEASSRLGLLERRGVVYPPDVTASLRRLAGDPWVTMASGTEMASWEGGSLLEGTVVRYLVGLPPGARAEMVRAGEPALLAFIEDLSLRELRIRDAEGRGLTLEEEVYSRLEEQHIQEVDFWMRSLGVERGSGVARGALDRYMEDMVSRQVEARSLTPLFEAWLLDGVDWTLEPSGISGAIDGARAMLVGAEY